MDVMLKKELEFIEQQQNARNKTLSYKEADWFVNYNMDDNTTALVVAGADGIGVLFIVLKNDHIDDFRKVIEQYDGWSKEIKGCLGECIRWAVKQDDIIPERCTIGGIFGPKVKIVSNQK